jgi:hypothetical protein
MFVALFFEGVHHWRPRKDLLVCPVVRGVGLESARALTGHASCLTTQRATAVTAASISTF